MLWGIGSFAYAWTIGVPGSMEPPHPMDAMGLLRRCHQLNVGLVEICDNLPIHELTDDELSALAQAAAAWGIQIRLGIRGIAPELLETYLDLCQRLASPTLRVVVDSAGHHPSPLDVEAAFRQQLPRLAEAGVRLLIENHDRFTAAELAGLMRRLDSPWVGICLDTVNSFGALEGPQVVVETLNPWVAEVHVKDFVVQRVATNMGFVIRGAPVGQGRLNVPWLLETLDAERRNIAAVIELWPAPEFGIDDTMALEDAWVVQSVEYLRGLLG